MFDTSVDNNNTWVLSNADGLGGTPVWTELSPTGTPPSPRAFFGSVYDPAMNQMTVFGGDNGNTGAFYNDVYTLSGANGLGGTPAWTQVSAGSPAPDPRAETTAVYNPTSRIMTVFGGANNSAIFGDVWVIAPSTSSSTAVTLTASNATYTGSAYATANLTTTVTPANAPGSVSYVFYSDATGQNAIATPINAGTYYVKAHFASTDPAQWTDADSSIVGFTIKKADAVIVVTPYNVNYDGTPYTVTGKATGVLGEPLIGLNLSGTTHKGPGVYVDTYSFTDSTGNYNNVASGVNFVTDKINITGLFSVDTQDALNVAKQGSITSTVTAHSASDYDTLLAISGGAFRYHFISSLDSAGVNLTATVVAGSYTGILDSNLVLTAQNNTTTMTALVGAGNTSASTSIAVTMVVQVNIDGTWYDLGSDTLKTFLSKQK